jgi:hypothetical protein
MDVRRLKWVMLGVLLVGRIGFAQNASSRHVFPQVADGRLSDGSSYNSALWVTNLSGFSTSCTLSTVGVPSDRFAGPVTQTIPSGYTLLNVTRGQLSLVTGYAVLQCSEEVQASLMYGFSAPNGATLGMATVFSAPSITFASIPVLTGSSARFGFAIANTSASPISILLFLTGSDGQSSSRTIEIPAQTQYVRFVDEIFTLPRTASLNILEIDSSSAFNVTALLFDGAVFTTLIPAVLP